MMRFILWLFSIRKENERTQGKRHRENIFHDMLLFVLLFGLAILVSNSLSKIHNDNNTFSMSIFILVVALIARCTRGYLYGIAASLLGVVCVNYMFTYPYWEFDFSLTGYPLTFLAMLIVSLCISTLTTRIKKQEQLRLAVEMEKMRGNLLRSVSHDLRTPLTSIVGSSSLLLEQNDLSDEERRELLQEINKDARWLARITENILSVTKFTGDRVRLKKEYEVLEEIISSAILKFRRSNAEVAVHVTKPDEILLAPMDGTLIEQVILNLLDNAAVHGKTTTRIQIEISQKDSFVHLRVIDNGCGIPSSMLDHLFDGTAYLSRSRADNQRNMGIGLSVCRSIIKAHNGTIVAYNMKEGGACFEFTLPSEEKCES